MLDKRSTNSNIKLRPTNFGKLDKPTPDLKNTFEQLQTTLDALPDLLFEIDIHGTIFDYRAPRPELLFSDPGTFLGKKVNEVLPKTASVKIMKAIKEADKKGSYGGVTYSLKMADVTKWFELSIAAKKKYPHQTRRFISISRDITERKEFEQSLKKKTVELKTERIALIEKNIALKQILDHIESDKKMFKHKLRGEVERALILSINNCKKNIDKKYHPKIEKLKSDLISTFGENQAEYEMRYSKLTSRESEVCELIGKGISSKEISERLSISLSTVLKHRELTRKKLGLTNMDISLATYIRLHN